MIVASNQLGTATGRLHALLTMMYAQHIQIACIKQSQLKSSSVAVFCTILFMA